MVHDANNLRAQAPLAGTVICCTSISPEDRARLADVATQMGATHKFDLTSDVTHLVVGNIDTQKYKYVAKERPDVKVLLPEWIEAVRQSWMKGGETDVAKLEDDFKVPTFHGLRICVTGFDDLEQRQRLAEDVAQNGADYHGDLTRSVTHLIVAKAQGKKYDYARQWGIKCVSIEWFEDSIRRGLVLDETLYNPRLSKDERGKGAFVGDMSVANAPIKRAGEALGDNPKRKLRRTASAKLSSQNQSLWADITAGSVENKRHSVGHWDDLQVKTISPGPTTNPETASTGLGTSMLGPKKRSTVPAQDVPHTGHSRPVEGIFQGRIVYMHGFEDAKIRILTQHLAPNGAMVVRSSNELEQFSLDELEQGFLILPDDILVKDLPGVPELGERLFKVTNWWVEKCLYRKELVDPTTDVTCRPFTAFSVPGFEKMTITSTGFTNVDLLHLSKVVKLIGATYEEYLKPETSVLICNLSKSSKGKLHFASERNIPTVSYAWLTDSLERGRKEQITDYLLQPLKESQSSEATSTKQLSEQEKAQVMNRSRQRAAKHRERRQEQHPAQPLPLPRKPSVHQKSPVDTATVDASSSHTEASSRLSSLPPTPSVPMPLQEISPNSPRRPSDASTKSASTDKPTPLTGSNDNETVNARSRAKNDESPPSTNAIAALIGGSRQRGKEVEVAALDQTAGQPQQQHQQQQEKQQLGARRRRGLLGRAESINSNHSASNSAQASLHDENDNNGQDTHTLEHSEPFESGPQHSQSLTYDDPDAQKARELMMRRIGGKMEVERGRVESVGTVTDVKPAGEEMGGVGSRAGRRGKRKD